MYLLGSMKIPFISIFHVLFSPLPHVRMFFMLQLAFVPTFVELHQLMRVAVNYYAKTIVRCTVAI